MRRSRGLTLIEILVVVAILGLLVAALLFYLIPSDDRRCKLEAERLAAWLTEASAEAVMRDGPTRAAFEFGEQEAVREVARIGAAITDPAWEKDERGEPFKTRAPVRFTSLQNAATGEVTGGSAWMVFDGRQTPGGVVTLELNEAVWSVIVPRGDGEIRVERGKPPVPERAPFFARQGDFGSPPGFSFEGLGDFVGGAGLPPLASGGDPPAPPPDDFDHDAGVPPPDLDAGPPPNPDAGAGGGGGAGGAGGAGGSDDPPDLGFPPDAAEEVDAGPECTGQPTPLHDSQCGAWKACDVNTRKCVTSPHNRTFRVTNVAITQPAGAQAVLQPIFDQQLQANRFNLMVQFMLPLGAPGPDQPYASHVFHGIPGPAGGSVAVFRPDPSRPAVQANAQSEQCGSQFDFCHVIHALENQNNPRQFTLWLDNPQAQDNQCPFHAVTVVADLHISATIDPATSQASAFFSLNGGIEARHARRIVVKKNGSANITLEKVLRDEIGIPKDWDKNGDGVKDGWHFGFTGTGSYVELYGDPSLQVNYVPPYCNQN